VDGALHIVFIYYICCYPDKFMRHVVALSVLLQVVTTLPIAK